MLGLYIIASHQYRGLASWHDPLTYFCRTSLACSAVLLTQTDSVFRYCVQMLLMGFSVLICYPFLWYPQYNYDPLFCILRPLWRNSSLPFLFILVHLLTPCVSIARNVWLLSPCWSKYFLPRIPPGHKRMTSQPRTPFVFRPGLLTPMREWIQGFLSLSPSVHSNGFWRRQPEKKIWMLVFRPLVL